MTTQITTDNISPTTLEVLGSAVPKVSTIAYPGDDTAANPAGGDTITLTGTGFVAGATVIINGTSAGVVTVVSGTTLTFTAPASSAGTYVIYVINSDGGTAIVIPGISYSGLPNWSTGAGSLGNIYEVSNVNTTVVATGDVPITYSLYSGNLPAGSNINGSTGLISGTAPAAGSPTTYSFVIKATDNEQQDTNRSFSLTINPDTVTWINPANASVTTSYEYANISNVSLSANTESNTSVSFSQSGLPAGLSLTGNTISGSSNTIANTSVTLTATGNVAGRTATRTVYFDVQQDVVTWSSPANNTTYESFTNSAISNVSLSASSAGGQSITYTANTLPTGVSVSGSVISGTATDAANTTTLLTATSALSNRTATRTINWVISVANDPYFKNVTLLLNGETTVTPFISDSSTNSFALTINGDTKPVLFNPYTPGYYSTFFNGSISSYISTPGSATSALNLGTGTCIEGYSYITAVSSFGFIISSVQGTGSFTPWWYVGHDNSGNWRVGPGDGTDVNLTSYPMTRNVWNHFALTNNGTATRLFVNGVLIYYKLVTPPNTDLQFALSQYGPNIQYLITGYLSNIRVIKGSANIPAGYVTSSTTLGTTVFTPSTTPLTAVTGTNLLICQSNRHIDTSTNAFALTLGSTTTINSSHPFTQNSSYSTYGSTYFDGTGDSLRAPYNAAFSFGTNDLTIECWIYNGSLTNASAVGQGQSSGSAGQSVGLFIVSAGTIGWYAAASTGGYGVTITGNVPLNQWNHVAGTRNGSTWTLWINGVSAGTATWAGTVTQDATGSNGGMDIGHLVGSYPYTGYISNVRVVNGTAVYTSGFTPSTTPLTAIANTQLLTLQYNGGATNKGVIDNSNFNNIITRNGNTSQGTFSPYSVTGWSNYFDGTGDWLTIPNNSAFTFGAPSGNTNDFTIEFWIYQTNTSITGPVCTAYSAGTTSYWMFNTNRRGSDGANVVGYLNFYMTDSFYIETTSGFLSNVWNHVAVSRTGTTVSLFLNGTEVATTTSSVNPNATGTLQMGGEPSALGRYLTGYISNLRIVKGTALYTASFTPSTTPLTTTSQGATSSQVSLLTCADNRLVDDSINNFTITKNGDVSVQRFSPFNPSLVTPTSYSGYFDGTGDYISAPYSSGGQLGSNNFTIELWINLSSVASGQQIVSAYTGATNYNYTIFTTSSGTLNYYLSSTGTSWNISNGLSIGNISVNTWYHVALVRNGSTFTPYLNGVAGTTATSASAIYSNTIPTYIGAAYNAGASAYVTGYISNLRIVNGTAVYTSAFTPPTTPLTAIANTVLLTCQSPTFIDNSINNFTISAFGNSQPTQQNPFGYTSATTQGYTASTIGGSGYFDGSGDYLQPSATANTAMMAIANSLITIEFWVYTTTIQAVTAYVTSIFGQYLGVAINGRYMITLAGSGTISSQQVRFAWTTSPSTDTSVTSSTYLNQNSWNHVAITIDSTTPSSSTITIYSNGVGQIFTVNNLSSQTVDNGSPFYIGAEYGGNYQGLSGYLSDFRFLRGQLVYKSNFVPPSAPLTAVQNTTLLTNMTSAGVYDAAMMNNMETVGDAKLSTAISKFGGSSMAFDGTGDYVLSSTSANLYAFGAGDFTIELWVYTNSVAATDQALVDFRTANGYYPYLYLFNGRVGYWLNSVDVITGSPGSITAGSWYHIALTRSGSSTKLFVNGTQSGSTYTSATALLCGVNRPAIGSSGTSLGAYPLNGYVDDLRVTKGYARYTANFTPPTSAFPIY